MSSPVSGSSIFLISFLAIVVIVITTLYFLKKCKCDCSLAQQIVPTSKVALVRSLADPKSIQINTLFARIGFKEPPMGISKEDFLSIPMAIAPDYPNGIINIENIVLPTNSNVIKNYSKDSEAAKKYAGKVITCEVMVNGLDIGLTYYWYIIPAHTADAHIIYI